MSNASGSCRKPELRECENCAEANWQYASFDEAKEQLVRDFFHNQRNPDAEFSEGIKPRDIKAGTIGSRGESSPATTNTNPRPAEQRGRSAVKGSEYGRRAVFIVLSGGHSKPAVPLTPEAEGALLVRVKKVKGLLNVWKPVEVHTSTLGKKVRRMNELNTFTYFTGEVGCHFRKLKAGEGSFQGNSRQHAIKNGSITRSLLHGGRGGSWVHSSTDSHRGTTVDAAKRQAL